MRAFADTNWLIAAYFPLEQPGRSAIVNRFAGRNDVSWTISRVVMFECENSFRAVGSSPNPPEWKALQLSIGNRILLSNDGWEAITGKAVELFQQFSFKASVGSLDMLVLASALKAEATHFLSFDTNSNLRALAALFKLKVVPELTAEDRRRMARFR